MDSLGRARAQFFAAIDGAMERGQRARKDRLSGQAGLFAAMAEETEMPRPAAAECAGLDQPGEADRRKGSARLLRHRPPARPVSARRSTELRHARQLDAGRPGRKGAEVALCGILTGIQRRRNKEGKPWASMQLEDLHGRIELLVFTTQYERLLEELVEDQAVLVRGHGAAGRERTAEDLGAGHRAAGSGARADAVADLDSGVASAGSRHRRGRGA